MKPYIIVLDCETGGFNEELHPITEVALLVIDSSTFKEVKRYQNYLKPYHGLEINPDALKATHVTMAKIESLGVSYVKVCIEIMAILDEFTIKSPKGRTLPILAGHNLTFDLNFLDKLSTIVPKFSYRKSIDGVIMDTHRMMQIVEANKPKSTAELSRFALTVCCERMGINFKSAHGAMDDVVATAKLLTVLYKKMRGSGEGKKAEVVDEVDTVKDRNFFEF